MSPKGGQRLQKGAQHATQNSVFRRRQNVEKTFFVALYNGSFVFPSFHSMIKGEGKKVGNFIMINRANFSDVDFLASYFHERVKSDDSDADVGAGESTSTLTVGVATHIASAVRLD